MKLTIRRALAREVLDHYGRRNVHPTRGRKVVFGFNYAPTGSPEDAGHTAYDYWFGRKKDAEEVAAWIDRTGWDGEGDLEIAARRGLYREFAFHPDRPWDLGKLYF